MFSDWKSLIPIVTSVITATVAIIAVMLTGKQIELSNKQHLFDKRIENYIIATGLIQLYRSNYDVINEDINNKGDIPIFSNKSCFNFLTNNTYLEKITCAIDNPLKEPSHKELLIKLENLKEVATKIKFLFSGKVSLLLEDFVLCYQELLFAMYKYQMVIDDMEKENENKNHELGYEEIGEMLGEKTQRGKLQKAFDKLKEADSKLKTANVEERIKKQIRL